MPKPDTTNIKTQADLIALIREMGTSQLTALQGLMDKVPANLKTEYEQLRTKMNTLLEKLPPLDGVPAAQEAAWALNSFARTVTELFEYVDAFRGKMATLADDLSAKTTALNGLQAKVDGKELVDKGTVEAAVQSAVTEAVKPYKAAIATMRKQQVALCGLPEAPAAILDGADDAFNASLTQAKANLKICTERGFALGGKGDNFIKRAAWLDQTAFHGENQLISDLADTLKIKLPVGADPFIGGSTAGGGTGETKPEADGGKPARRLTIA